MIYVSIPQDRVKAGGGRVRLGADACPGTGEYGKGLNLRILHDDTCCGEWEAGQTPWPRRAEAFRRAAARWGAAWPPGPAPGEPS